MKSYENSLLPQNSSRRTALGIHAHDGESEAGLRNYLNDKPDDTDAITLLAQIEERNGRKQHAAKLWKHYLELAPDMDAARVRYSRLLAALGENDAALSQLEIVLSQNANDALAQQLKANILGRIGEFSRALEISERLVTTNPAKPETWLNYGHALRACGYQDRSIAAYREALTRDPKYGRAWWGLSDFKTFRFRNDDVVAMEELLSDVHLMPNNRPNVLFALGRAYEDRHDYARSWDCYAKANAALRLRIDYDPGRLAKRIAEIKSLMTLAFFANRTGIGYGATDPIFILGQPRSGSTLIEQILASHSEVEGAGELPYINLLAKELDEETDELFRSGHVRSLERLEPSALYALGEKYLEKAKPHRKTGRPFIIDKNPSNYLHVGFIRLILPNAKIIDARRNPAACLLSMFKQNFSKNNLRLGELGKAYRDYVELMAHFDAVFPGSIHRIIYEDLVSDPEKETRRLLDYLGLPFEESCLRFYETKRAVLTPSSEQVRKPISSDAVSHWKCYEQWLGSLTRSLGSVLTSYPDIPQELQQS